MALAIMGIGARGFAPTYPIGVTPLWRVDLAMLNVRFYRNAGITRVHSLLVTSICCSFTQGAGNGYLYDGGKLWSSDISICDDSRIA